MARCLRLVLLVLIACAPAILAAPSATERAARGIELASARDYRGALALLEGLEQEPTLPAQQLALTWQARGACYLGLLNEQMAASAFRRALELDPALPESAYQLGVMHATATGTYQDDALAEELLLRAGEQDHRAAQRELARRYLDEKRYDPQVSHQWLMRAVRGGDPAAQMMLAARYEQGRGIIRNDEEAFRWYLRAAEQGEARAQYKVATAYATGAGVKEEMAAYRHWMESAAESGYRDAAFRLGQIHAAEQDEAKASYWYWRAAELQHKEAAAALGVMYLNGQGVARDFEEALYWFEATGNHPLSLYYRGVIAEKGLVGDANPERAFGLYRSAAQQRYVPAMVKTGMMLMGGYGTERDTDAGAAYIRALGGLTDPGTLNGAAWQLVTDDNPELRSATLAETFIEQAIDRAGKRADLLDTEAAVHAEAGRWRRAVRTQKRALRALEEERYREEMERHLAHYERELPWRESYAVQPASKELLQRLESLAHDLTITGSIVRMRAAQGAQARGLLIDRAPTHLMEIAVQSVVQGTLPTGQEEHLVLFVRDPVRYYPGATESTTVTDYPLELVRISLNEVPTDRWHRTLSVSSLAPQ